MKRRVLVKSFSIFLSLVVTAILPAVLADAEINLKPFEISGQIQDGFLYNSNPGYADRNSTDSSWGNNFGGSLDVSVPFGGIHKYTVGAEGSWTEYFNNSAYDTLNASFFHDIDLVFNEWALNFHQSAKRTETPDAEHLAFIRKNLMKSWDLGSGLAVQVDLGKMDLSGGFDYLYNSNNSDYKVLDSDTYTGFIDTAYEIIPALDAYGRYTITRVKRRSTLMSDSLSHRAEGGLRGDFTPYLSGEAGIGWEYSDYKTKKAITHTSDFSGLIFKGSVTNRLSSLTTQELGFSLTPEQGYEPGQNYYRSWVTQYNVTHTINKYLSLTGLAQYVYNKEEGPADRREMVKIWVAGAGLQWLVTKNLSVGFNYDFTYRDSNRHGHDFRQHSVGVSLINNF